MSQLLVKLFTPILDSQFTVSDSFDFCQKISSCNFNRTAVIVSYDIKSLFTNIPVDETCKIILDKLFPLQIGFYNG